MSIDEAPSAVSIPYALDRDEGEVIRWFGDTITVKSAGPTFDIAVVSSAAGGEPPRHLHPECDEAIYVLEGALVVFVGDEAFEAAEGTFVSVPATVPHRLVVTSRRARLLTIQSPSGVLDAYGDAQHASRP